MADLKLNTTNGSVTLKPEDGSGNVDVSIPRAGVGKVLQVQQSLNGTSYTYGSGIGNWYTSDCNITIIAQKANSKFKVDVSFNWDISNPTSCAWRIKRIGKSDFIIPNTQYNEMSVSGTNNGSTHWTISNSFSFLDDSGCTEGESITYALELRPYNSTRTVYLNHSAAGVDIDDAGATIMIATEIAN